jgi:hypothetical protein
MPVVVQFPGERGETKSCFFDDSVETVVIGRDPLLCQVALPASDERVGKEHCALVRDDGRYRLRVVNRRGVLVNGKFVKSGEALPDDYKLQLGADGPILSIRSSPYPALPPTFVQQLKEGVSTILVGLQETVNRNRFVTWCAIAGLTLLLVGVFLRSWWSDPQRLSEVVRAAEPSIYLVTVSEGGVETPCGTAWVIKDSDGLLATTAHVAEMRHPKNAMFVRSPAPNSQRFEVKDVTIHPGYKAFNDLWNNFRPIPKTGTQKYRDAAVKGCDVALLHVENPKESKLGRDLPLAAPEKLCEMQPGEPIGCAGYPTEGQAQGGVRIDSPVPVRHSSGEITQVTDFFRAREAPSEQRLLIGHSFVTAGGSSGSPILNRSGEVVAIHCAGDPEDDGDVGGESRHNSSVIGFGVRSDLLRELLLNTAKSRTDERSEQWKAELERCYKRGKLAAHSQ